MPDLSATAIAHPNIAFIKYWGNRDQALRLPQNGSISMNLDGLFTRTTVTFDPALAKDTLEINARPILGGGLTRVAAFLDQVRALLGKPLYARVSSENNFPIGAGIASSASAFAALSLAGSAAAGLSLSEAELSRLARLGSGSACRSIPAGFVEWETGSADADSIAHTIAPSDHWDLVDCIAVIQTGPKSVGSTEGHHLADTSPLQAARVADTPRRLDLCRQAILNRDFDAFAQVVEQDSNIMHAVMMTSVPPLFYWEPASLRIIKEVQGWRQQGLPVCCTLDAGPNVHVLCLAENAPAVRERLSSISRVQQVIIAPAAGGAHLASV